jgi:spore germination protein KC
MQKVRALLLIILIFPYIISGCTSDSNEIDDQVYALQIGVDKGVENKVRLTIQYATYKGGGQQGGVAGGGGGGEEKSSGQVDGTVVTTIEASSILDGINMLNASATRQISLVHTKAFIFSEELAYEGLAPYMETISRFRETRRISTVGVCRGKAEDYIKESKALVGENVSKAIELALSQSQKTGLFPRAYFTNFYRDMISPYSQAYALYVGLNEYKNLKKDSDGEADTPLKTEEKYLPGEIPRRGDIKQEFIGTAVFDGDKMVGSLDSQETRYFMMVTGKFRQGVISIEDKNKPGMAIPFELRPGRNPKIKARFERGKPVIYVNLNLEADIGAIQSRIQYESLGNINELNKMIKENIENGVKKTIEKTQKQMGSDVFGFGYYIADKFWTINELEKYNWLKHYKDARFNVQVEAHIRRTGLVTGSSPIRGSK